MLQKNKLDFSDFFSISPEQWKKNILKELKANSEEALQTISENLVIQGFYTAHDIKDLTYLKEFHERFKIKSPRHWYTAEYIPYTTSKEWNVYAHNAIQGGADCLIIDAKEAPSYDDHLFKNIPLDFAYVILKSELGYNEFLTQLRSQKLQIKGVIEIKGLWNQLAQNKKKIISTISNSISLASAFPKVKVLGIESPLYHSNPAEQIASLIGVAIELIDQLTENGIDQFEVLSQLSFSLPIGKNYLIEISKIRALRVLWEKVCNSIDPNFNSFITPIHCTTSEDLSINDPNINNIQNTVKAMAAIIGGCDILSILPADKNINSHNGFSARIARNISLILKDESHLDYVLDPAAGAYAIEALTDQIAKASLEKLKEIEMKGGLVQFMKGSKAL
jgi:methylmalonyl-CoA mutase